MRKRALASGGTGAQASADRRSVTDDASSGATRGAPRWLPWLPLLLLAFVAGLLALTIHRHHTLPRPLSSSSTPSHRFSEERARVHLNSITSFGVRTTGNSNNEIKAVHYLLKTLAVLQNELGALEEHRRHVRLEVQIQRPSGTFDLDFLNGFTSSYTSVTNVIARLTPLTRSDPPLGAGASLLVSGHFDSALGTKAATDDIANIANMLEVLRALVHRPSGALSAPVLFLFNGAEETILQAAHGFITQHPWARDVSAFINLEGAGGSGRELVFQTGPKHQWLAGAYSSAAPYPFASILAQDIFQSGVIPSDTDFRIFRDFGNVPGIDIAYIDNGYIYHTDLDTAERVAEGAMQRCGENLLATVEALADSPYLLLTHRAYKEKCVAHASAGGNVAALVQRHDDALAAGQPSPLSQLDLHTIAAANVCLNVDQTARTSAVYFDVLGMVVIIYSVATSLRLNWAASLIVLLYLARQAWRRRRSQSHSRAVQGQHGFFALAGLTLVSFLGAIVAAALAGVVTMLLVPMTWFGHDYLVGGLFLVPSLLAFTTLQRHFFRGVGAASSAKVKDEVPLPGGLERTSREDSSQPRWLRVAFEREEAAYDAALTIWAALLVLLTLLNVGSAFLALSWCVVPLFARTAARWVEKALFRLQRPVSAAANSAGVVPSPSGEGAEAPKGLLFLCAYLLGMTLPVIIFLQSSLVVHAFFVPLMGRSGTEVPSDILIGTLLGALLAVAGLMALSVMHLLNNWPRVRNVLLGVVGASLLFALSPAGFPYAPDTPKRMYVIHVAREFHPLGHDSYADRGEMLRMASAAEDVAPVVPAPSTGAMSIGAATRAARTAMRDAMAPQDSGLWLITMDSLSMRPLRSVRVPPALMGIAPDASRSFPGADKGDGLVDLLPLGVAQQCSANATETRARLFCDLPYYLPLPNFVPGNMLFPLPASHGPSRSLQPRLRLVRAEHLPALSSQPGWVRRRRLHFEVSNGPAHMTLYVNNRVGFSRVRQWSFGASVEESAQGGRPTLGSLYERAPGQPTELFVYFASGMPLPVEGSNSSLASSLLSTSLPAGAPAESFDTLSRSWSFWIEVADDAADVDQARAGPMYVDMALAGHYHHEDQNKFAQQIAAYWPEWLSPVNFMSFFDSFHF